MLQMRKLRLRDVRGPAQWQRRDLNPALPDSQIMYFLSSVPYRFAEVGVRAAWIVDLGNFMCGHDLC